MPDFEPLLQSAQHIINTYHKNESEFFAECNFLIEFAQETDEAFGFVDGKRPNYGIGIDELFDRFTEEDQRFITMTIVHELLHIIHADWNENQIILWCILKRFTVVLERGGNYHFWTIWNNY